MTIMPAGKEPEPGAFARAVAEEIRLALTRHRISGAQLAVMIGRSQSYVSKRLRSESSFTANDVEAICRELNEDLLKLITTAIRSMRAQGPGSAP
ncbi:helix-turn-helix transcriptional regulator [Pseudarthrobacter sp. LT1]|uniref:helix-turn-helix domain-containing protein n=1 Tax=Pseudarthrobacter sp. LT1 TaxID=3111450 RepID=UPI002D7930CA|nr:helix-turn-helix transcriptional regulator [Pseudarthrobacter sp. LT1]WRT14702.1 helix-turn-helix transcriptional regulator [Pseudarthrobacter sp. LT1]